MAAYVSSARAAAGAVSRMPTAEAHTTARTDRRTFWIENILISFASLKDRVPGDGAQNPQAECNPPEQRRQ